MNISPEILARERKARMTLMPKPKKLTKITIRKDVEGDLAIEKRLLDLMNSGKVEKTRIIKVTNALAVGGSDVYAPSLIFNGKRYMGAEVNNFIDNL